MPRRNQIGDWRCVERDEGHERWEHPEHGTVELRRDPEAPPGERWTWCAGERTGNARTNGDAFSTALRAAGAVVPRRPSGPSGQSQLPRRALVQPAEDFEAQDSAAAVEGVSWAEWIRDAARRKLARLHRPTKVEESVSARLVKRAR